MKSAYSRLYNWTLVTILCVAGTACSGIPTNAPSSDNDSSDNTRPWKDAVRSVCSANKVKLSRIKINKYNHHHTFVVSFPHDPRSLATAQYFNQLYARLLVANDMHNYALRDTKDKLQIQINWNRNTNVMTTVYVPLQNSIPNME